MFYSSEEAETFAVTASELAATALGCDLDASTENYLVYEEVCGPIVPLDVLLELVEPIHSADKLAKLVSEAVQRSHVRTLKSNLKAFRDLELLMTTSIPSPGAGLFLQLSCCHIDHESWISESKVVLFNVSEGF